MSADARVVALSLAAAFLALALGVVIGAAYVGDDLERGQLAVLQRLEADFVALRAELTALRQRAARGDAVAVGLARWAVAGRLAGMEVHVVAEPAAAEAEALELRLREAGAVPRRADLVALLAGSDPGAPDPGTAAGAVLVWPGREPAPAGLAALVRRLRAAGYRVVAYEPAGAPHPLGVRWRQLGVPAVSGLEGPAGHAAVVALLAGADGVYGPLRGADGLLPPPPGGGGP